MKRTLLFSLLATLAVGVGACQKQQTEAERNAEIERQQRLHAKGQADDRKKMAQLQAELVARMRERFAFGGQMSTLPVTALGS